MYTLIIIGCLFPLQQFLRQMMPSTVLGLSELLNGSSTRPPVENADSDGTVVTGTANTSRAMADKTLYFSEFSFHHPKMSNY